MNKEDKKAFWKMILFIVIGGVIGFFVGMLAVGTEAKIAQFAEVLKEGARIIAPFGNLFFGTLTWIVAAVLMKKSRKIYAGWDGEDENVIDEVEMKLTYAISLTSVNLIVCFFFFGLGVYTIEFAKLRQTGVLFDFVIVFVGYFYSMIVNTIWQKNLVNFTKEINPEKRGSVYDTKFQNEWLESCDESEKLQIYQAGYAAMKAGGHACMGLWIVCIIGMMTWNFGIVPMIMVLIIWLVLVVRYNAECIRLSKHS